MGATRSLRRKLNAEKVLIAEQVAEKRTEIVKKFVEERVKTDAEFAADVLKAVGDALPENIKTLAEETVNTKKKVDLMAETRELFHTWENVAITHPSEHPPLMTPVVSAQKKVDLVKKWEKTGLFDGLADQSSNNKTMVTLVEAQAKELLIDDAKI